MWFSLFIALSAALLTLLPGAFLSAWPAGWQVNLPLLLIVGLVVSFRFREATIAAVAAGLTADLLTASGVGPHLLAYLLTTAAAYWLFTRVFTNPTPPSFLAMNGAAVIAYGGLCALGTNLADSWLLGLTPTGPRLTLASIQSLVLQLLIATLCLLATRLVRNALTSHFLFSDHET